jgi:hypothetical protein
MTTTLRREVAADEAALSTRELIEYCYERGWTDGLPVVPATEEIVAEFLAQTDRDPNEVIMYQPHLNRRASVRVAAINAVMAGCKPEYFPVVLALLDAFEGGVSRTNLMQSTTGQAIMTIVNGPIRNELGFNSTGNIFGPGDRANSTVGRTVRLVIMNALGIRPHEFDQSTQGGAAKYACVIAENEEDSPWEPLHVELGYPTTTSTVTVQMFRSDIYVEHRMTQVPEEILETIADTMSNAGMITQVTEGARMLHGSIVVIGPEHAGFIAARAWSKTDVKQFLFERFGKTVAQLRRYGKMHPSFEDQPDDAFIKSATSPDSLMIIVAGANNAGVSAVCNSITVGRPGMAANTTREVVRR